MIKHMAALLLLAFMLMGCFVDPGSCWATATTTSTASIRESMAAGTVSPGLLLPRCGFHAGDAAKTVAPRHEYGGLLWELSSSSSC